MDLDGEIQLHWDDENEVRDAIAAGSITLTPEEVWTRRHEYDLVAAKFIQRCKDIKREAKGEERDRIHGGDVQPEALDGYLASGKNDPMVRDLGNSQKKNLLSTAWSRVFPSGTETRRPASSS